MTETGQPRHDALDVETPVGPARAFVHWAAATRSSSRSRATLALGHGAGGGIGARDLAALAARLPALGVTVVLVEQPWRTAGRKVAAPRAQLDLAWVAAMNSPALRRVVGTVPLIVGGRSAGARVACRTAQEVGAAGVLALAFPLHPPGRPELSRVGELLGAVSSPVLVVQGARDPFGRPSEFPADPPVVSIPYADHGFAVPRRSPTTQEEVIDQIVEAAVSGFGKNFRVALLEPA